MKDDIFDMIAENCMKIQNGNIFTHYCRNFLILKTQFLQRPTRTLKTQ